VEEDVGAEKTEAAAEGAFSAIERRVKACGVGASRYPFEVGESSITAPEDPIGNLYVFLLLVSIVGVDVRAPQIEAPAILFEQIACQTAGRYFGAPAAEVKTFRMGFPRRGTATGFRDALAELCTLLREGTGPSLQRPNIAAQKDAGLDVVVWRHFADERPGQLIGFGQCAAGNDWKDKLTQHDPKAFIDTWLAAPIVVPPVRFFFVPHQVDRDAWFWMARQAGLLFDRVRMVQYGQDLDPALMMGVSRWCSFVLAKRVRA
jgi:hypothetical protein